MIRLSWVVFVHAILLSFESILIEVLTTQLSLAPLVIAGNSIMIAGAALLAISAARGKSLNITIFRAWRILLPASALLAVGVFAWYDSVTYIGASKEGLLSGPLEVVVIIMLARLVLKERLSRPQAAGATIALAGFFATIVSAGSLDLLFTWGDVEAIISAMAFGTGIIMITRLAKNYSALEITGASLLISGVILAAAMWSSAPLISLSDWAVILGFSLLPLFAAYTYVVGLARIGASATSIIGSFSILLTVVFQLGLVILGAAAILPANIPLAITGGALGIFGIYLIHRQRGNGL
ncbi:MAG TPA: DMT family transporter [Nitrososphaera sp.]|nr:DMT family transporter [Nitrososphaera sp.]